MGGIKVPHDDMFNAFMYSLKHSIIRDLYRSNPTYEDLEFDCTTSVTDEDILRIQIDHALDTGNKELFIQLSGQLAAKEENVKEKIYEVK